MCGRYASSKRPDELVDEFGIEEVRVTETLEADYNVAPTKDVYAVVARPREDEPPQRQLRVVKWGLVPSWAKDPGIGSRLINARMETVAEKPAFRKAFQKRRCLLPADGYYEWYVSDRVTKSHKPAKQAYFIRPKDGGTLAMAGLYEFWPDPAKAEDDPDRWRWTCTVITADAEDDLGRIHERMPLMVEPERWAEWLDPGCPGSLDLLVPAAPGRLEAYPVGNQVSNVRNNGPQLIDPLPLEEAPR
jgi:putative SOS response-associated peptidase YedK